MDNNTNSTVITTSQSGSDDGFCFFPRNFLLYIRTPVFVLNSLSRQLDDLVLPHPPFSANASWRACRDRTADCTVAQLEVLKDESGASLARQVREGLSRPPTPFPHCTHPPPRVAPRRTQHLRRLHPWGGVPLGVPGRDRGPSGACLFSCNFHSAGLWTKRWHGPRVQGRTFAEIVGRWFEGQREDNFYVDCQELAPMQPFLQLSLPLWCTVQYHLQYYYY